MTTNEDKQIKKKLLSELPKRRQKVEEMGGQRECGKTEKAR
jgi:hypothetical protein